ncbi:MAG: hypothetical protein ACK47E_16260 [Cyclobacteriaceae bacterium]|jgi:hypothetical protein
MRILVFSFTVTLSLCFSDNANCQLVDGKYIDVSCVSGENCIELRLSKDKFHIQKTGSLGSKIGEGSFIEKKDSLILNLTGATDTDTSTYIIAGPKLVPSEFSPLILNVKITEVDGTPIRYVWISYYNNTEMLSMNFADSTGKSTFWIYNKKMINNIRLCMMGYKCITMPTSIFKQGEYSVNATLKPVLSFLFNPKELRFKIVKRKHGGLELTNSEYTLRFKNE